MAKGTTSTTSALLKQYWQKFFLSNLYDRLQFKDIAKETAVPKGNGTVCWWFGMSKVNPVGAALTEGSDPTARSSAATRISATIKEYGNLITNSTLLMDTSIPGTREAIIADLAKDGAKTLDNVVRDAAIAGGTVLYADGKLHRSDIVKAATATLKDIRKAVRLLETSSVPYFGGESYAGLILPDVKYDLQSDSAWTDVTRYRDTVKYDLSGEVGKIWGVRFKLAPTIPVLTNSGSAGVDIYRTMVLGEEFVGLSEIGHTEIIINEPARGSELKAYNAYGYKFRAAAAVLSNQKAIRIESSASLGSN